MKPDPLNPSDPHEAHRFHSAELARLVALAQAQPLPRLRNDTERLHAGFLAARQARNRRLSRVGGVALAAGLAALVLVRADLGALGSTSPIGHVAQDMSRQPAANGVVEAPRLATGVRVVARGEATPAPTVRGPWEVELAPGSYEAEVEPHPGPELLRARSAAGSVDLHHGRVEIVVGASQARANLREGVATWVAPDGQRSELTATPATPDATTPHVATPHVATPHVATPHVATPHVATPHVATPHVATPDVATPHVATPPTADAPGEGSDVRALARRAEALLTSGQRDGAIAVLTQITRLHAHEPAARAALLDLAPLLKAAGRVDEARCAYRLYLERYPARAQLADDVRKALDRLGDGPACDGLDPR